MIPDCALSILLPTVRSNEVFDCVKSIHLAAEGLDYEIIVVADFPHLPQDNKLKWYCIPERNGPVKAICDAQDRARGEYFFICSDEDRLLPGTLTQLYNRASKYKKEQIYVPYCGAIWRYYGIPFPPFPFISRSLSDRLGKYLLDKDYHAHYADPDLGMRAHVNHVPLMFCEDILINHPNNVNYQDHIDNRAKYYETDKATFRLKWDKLGTFIET